MLGSMTSAWALASHVSAASGLGSKPAAAGLVFGALNLLLCWYQGRHRSRTWPEIVSLLSAYLPSSDVSEA